MKRIFKQKLKRINNVIARSLSIVLLTAIMSGCDTDIDSGTEPNVAWPEKSQSYITQPDNSQADDDLLSDSQDVETQLTPVLFMKYVSYPKSLDEDATHGLVSFFANDGSHYVSVDSTLVGMYPNKVAEKFEEGTLSDYITLHTKCEKDELKKKYLQVSDLIKSGDFQIVDPTNGPDVEASTVIWYGVYYDENNKLQYRLIHQTDAIGEHTSDNDTLNEVYAWLLEHEKQDISNID